MLKLFLSNLFRLRLEEGETVTYRKHGFVLLQQIWLPSLILIVLFSWWLGRIIYLGAHPEQVLATWQAGVGLVVDSLVLALPIISIPFHLWWIYQYWDWANDIFQVSPDQIVDIDKKPFGYRGAPRGLAGEYPQHRIRTCSGSSVIFLTLARSTSRSVGSKLEFQDVYDPATVQSDIDRRRMARAAAKNAATAAVERERMAEWLATYHLNSEELHREQGSNPPNPE